MTLHFPILRFFQGAPPEYRQPSPAVIPASMTERLFALYREARRGGDFYDFLEVDRYVVLLLCDVSGTREQALPIAAAIQDLFRERGPDLFSGPHLNLSERLTEFTLVLNRGILQAANGVRHCPAFLGCYDRTTGTLTYVNAGHTAALVRDSDGVSTLDASGLPLGLFSHAIHDAQFCVLRPGASLLLVSKGIVETRRASQEFGLERLKRALLHASVDNPRQLCVEIHADVKKFASKGQPENDLTAVALLREPRQPWRSGASPVHQT